MSILDISAMALYRRKILFKVHNGTWLQVCLSALIPMPVFEKESENELAILHLHKLARSRKM
jgi:hypothetical protein